MTDIKLSSVSTKMGDTSIFMDIIGESIKTSHDGNPVEMIVYRLDDVSLPSGKIVAEDGFIMDCKPFTQRVKEGSYPLFLAIAKFGDDERVAFALLRFSQTAVAKWEMACTEGQDINKLEPGNIFGYGVDSGTGCFCDPGAQQIINEASGPDMKFFNLVSREMDKSYTSTRGWVHIDTPKGSAALFSSGFGDGLYASYFGLDETGNPVALVTDFGIVDWPRRPK